MIKGVSRPLRLILSDHLLKKQRCCVRLMNRLCLPKTVLMLADLAVENGSRRVEENATPKLPLSAIWKISEDINATPRPELLAVQPFHSLDEGGVFGPATPLRDLNAKVEQTSKLHVVQLDELLFECDLASHARDAA